MAENPTEYIRLLDEVEFFGKAVEFPFGRTGIEGEIIIERKMVGISRLGDRVVSE